MTFTYDEARVILESIKNSSEWTMDLEFNEWLEGVKERVAIMHHTILNIIDLEITLQQLVDLGAITIPESYMYMAGDNNPTF